LDDSTIALILGRCLVWYCSHLNLNQPRFTTWFTPEYSRTRSYPYSISW